MTDAARPLKNERHERFAQLLVKHNNGSKAYIEAGYSPKDTGGASKLTGRPLVRARIEFLREQIAVGLHVDADKVVREFAALGFSNMLDYIRIGADGEPSIDLSNITREQAAAIQEVVVEDFVDGRGENARDVRRVRFKLADKKGALDSLAKHLGMFIERHEVVVGTAAELERRFEEARRRAVAAHTPLRLVSNQ